MQVLTASESHLLGRRFARGLAWAAFLLGLGFVGLTAFSVVQDLHGSRRVARDSSRHMSETLRQLSDQVLEQASYSLNGLSEAVAPARTDEAPGQRQVEALLKTVIRYDTGSEYLFVRRTRDLTVVGSQGRLAHEADALVQQLLPPEIAGQLELRAPISLDGGRSHLLPVLMALAGYQNEGPVLIGALIPVASLLPSGLAADNGGNEVYAIYLPSGVVLSRSADGPRQLGAMAPESAALARLARESLAGPLGGTLENGQDFSGTFRRSDRYPVVVACLLADRLYLQPWAQRSSTKMGLLALALLALVFGLRTLRRMLRSLARSESVYRRLFEDVGDGVIVHTADARIVALNTAALKFTGLARTADAIGRSLHDFLPPPRDPATGQPSQLPQFRMARALAGEHLRYEYSFDSPVNRQHFDCDVRLSAVTLDGAPQLMCLIRDLTEERRQGRQQEYLANHDPLTGLPNRHSLLRMLDERIEKAPEQAFELVFVNLARFKEVNEAFGHRAADMVLETTARRIERQLGLHGWTLARAGGTDFVAVPPLTPTDDPLSMEALCEIIMRVAREPITMGETSVELHVKLGLADYPGDALDAGQLLRCADMAAARARTVVGAQVRYSKSFENAPGHDLKMRAELSAAIRDNQLQLAWQPKLWLESREIEGVEALLRWHHPRLGWVSPGEFIPLAESTELIYPLTRWVLGAALDQMALWLAAGQPLKVAVNISANNLQDPDFIDHVKDLLQRKQVPAQLLELEVTETALAANPEVVLRRLQDLRATGVSLALDDFGTGYSSLSYVSQFPFTTIKIDRGFVSALLRSPRDRHVAESTIALGRKLGLRTVAEGVEDDATASALLALECDIGQGYLFARPLMGQAFDYWRSLHETKLAEARRQASASPGR